MIVALGTGYGKPQQRTGHDLQCVGDDLVPCLRRIIAAGGSIGCRPQETGGRQEFDLFKSRDRLLGSGQFVAGQLFL